VFTGCRRPGPGWIQAAAGSLRLTSLAPFFYTALAAYGIGSDSRRFGRKPQDIRIPRMTKIVDLHHYRTQMVEERTFGPWRKRFGETYNVKTCLTELSDKTLYFLARPGEHCAVAYYEAIMGVLDLGPAAKFDYLPSEEQMRVVDIHLFLADQLRFEMMRRLTWLDALACQKISIVEMIRDFEMLKTMCRNNPPQLASFHPAYKSYQNLTARDKEVFIRQLLREALEEFPKRFEK
jgi:hypothetical protein